MSARSFVRGPFWLEGPARDDRRSVQHVPSGALITLDRTVASWWSECAAPTEEACVLRQLSGLGVRAPDALLSRMAEAGLLVAPDAYYERGFAGVTLVGFGPFGHASCPAGNLQVIRDASLVVTLEPADSLAFLQENCREVVSLEEVLAQAPREQALQRAAGIAFDRLRQPGSVFAFRGHPVVGSAPVSLLRELATDAGVPVHTLPAASFLDVLYAELGLDPFCGMAVVRPWQITQVSAEMIAVVVGFGYGLSLEDKRRQIESFCSDLRRQRGAGRAVLLLWREGDRERRERVPLDALAERLAPLPNGVASVVVGFDGTA